jgi:DNA-binding CsgD family transcriptional regulator
MGNRSEASAGFHQTSLSAGLFSRPLRYFLGMAFLEAWTQVLYSSKIMLLPPAQMVPLSITHLFSTFAVVLASLLMMLGATRLSPLLHRRKLLYGLAALGASATVGVSLVSIGALGAYWIFACVSLTALSGSIIGLAWVEALATLGVRGALIAYGLSVAGGGLLSFLLTFLPQLAAIPLAALLPLLGVLTLRPFANPLLISCKGKRPTLGQLFLGTPWQFVLVVGIVSLAFGAVRTSYLPADPITASTTQWLTSILLGLLAFVLAGAVAFISYHRNIAGAYYIAIPFLALASLLLAADLPAALMPLLSVTSVGTDMIRLLVWLLLIAAVASRRVPAVFAFAFLSAMQFMGTLFGQLIAVAAGENRVIISFAVLVALLGATLVVVSARSLLSPLKAKVEPNPLVLLSERYRLSPRESEIIEIWLSGHTGAYIEKKLDISKNTVKTHLSHIYQKTGTQNKEELLALLESLG